MKRLDKNGEELYIGADVEVPGPIDNDQWNFDFVGVIIEFKEDYCVVEDGDGDCWCVESERLELS
jgi:hypothetical protein